jgi:rhodanese-related sulfurtransferase
MAAQGFKAMIARANAVIDTISVHDALTMVSDDKAVFVDVREAGERAQGTIPGSIHAPRGFLEFIADPQGPMHKPELASGKRIVVFCASGGRSALASKTLVNMGLKNVANMAGGIAAWKEAGGIIATE